MHPIRIRGAVGALLVSLAVVACGGTTATTAPGATTAAGATVAPPAATGAASAAPSATSGSSFATTGRIEVPDKGYAVTLPDGWNRVDVANADLAGAIRASGQVDPALVDQFSTQIKAMQAAGLSVFAFGPDPTAPATLMMLSIPGAGMSLDLLEQINTAQLEALAASGVESERITLPAGDAIHYQYTVTGQTGSSPTVDQYLILAGANQLIVSVTGAAGEAEAIANSIEVLD
jgi:hypothetical protein